MILKLKNLSIKDERHLKSFTGISQKQYDVLRPVFEKVIGEEKEGRAKPISNRKRKKGGGRKPSLPTIDDQLCFILHYKKVYPSMDNLGSTFTMARSTACNQVHFLASVLKTTLERLEVIPKRKLANVEELLNYLKELGDINELLIDVTERPYRRLRNKEERDALYSGKKSDLR